MRCCDNCEPRLFEVEQVTLEKGLTLKHGKKRRSSPALEDAVGNDLIKWRDNDLLDTFYGGTSIIAGAMLLGDDVIEKLVTCGERVETMEEFVQQARWPIGFNTDTGDTTDYGRMLLDRLQFIYSTFDETAAIEGAESVHLQPLSTQVDTASFYAASRLSQQPRWTATLTTKNYLQLNSNVEPSGSNARGMRRGIGRGRQARGAT